MQFSGVSRARGRKLNGLKGAFLQKAEDQKAGEDKEAHNKS